MTSLLKAYQPPGTSPGTLTAAGSEHGQPQIFLLQQRQHRWEQREVQDPRTLKADGAHMPVWVHVLGLGDAATVQAVGEAFGLHVLALEDALHPGQRPKVEDYAPHTFAVFQCPVLVEGELRLVQLALFFTAGFVVTFQSHGPDILAPVRARLVEGRMGAQQGMEYLVYLIMDIVVDNAFPVLERLGERLSTLEERIVAGSRRQANVDVIHRLRRDLLRLHRVFWPQRDIFAHFLRDESQRFAPAMRVYLRDLHDHAVQVLDVVDGYREMAASLLDLHFSSLTMRLSEVMRVLTMISTVFMPLTFIAGVYGMNFDRSSPWNMPELGWEYGYPAVLGLMLLLAGGMLLFFRRRGWL